MSDKTIPIHTLSYLRELVGHWIIRTSSNEYGLTGFKEEPVFLFEVTDDHILVAHHGIFRNLPIYDSLFDTAVTEIASWVKKKKLKLTKLTPMWVDDHWIKYHSLFQRSAVPYLNMEQEKIRNLIGQLIVGEGMTNVFYLYNSTPNHMLVVNFGSQENYEHRNEYKYSTLEKIEDFIKNGILKLEILSDDFFPKEWIRYDILINRETVELHNNSAQSMSRLEGRFAIRSKKAKGKYPGYLESPIYIYKVTNYHVLAYNPSSCSNQDFPYNGETPEQINLAIQLGILNLEILVADWMDENWIEYHFPKD